MGGQHYLTRLALGRSAFEDADAAPPETARPRALARYISPSGRSPDQAFDSKGRPVRPAADARNAEQRNAQNAVLALMGVANTVEREERADRPIEPDSQHVAEARQDVVQREDDFGDDMEFVVFLSSHILSWWPNALVARAQAGLYPAATPFAAVLADELRLARTGSWQSLFAVLLPGAPIYLLHTLLQSLLDKLIAELASRLQELAVRQAFSRRTTQRIYATVAYGCHALFLVTRFALLPLEFYGAAQHLGLAPSRPLLPPWYAFVPSHPACVYRLGWSFTSFKSAADLFRPPALLLFAHSVLTSERIDNPPLISQFTHFERPEVNARFDRVEKPHLSDDALGWVLYQVYYLRTKLLSYCGWELELADPNPGPQKSLQNNRTYRPTSIAAREDFDCDTKNDSPSALSRVIWTSSFEQVVCHRSTSLTHLPALYLSTVSEVLCARVFTLPLVCLLHRSIAISYLDSAFPKTALAASSSSFSKILVPFPLTSLSGWQALGTQLNKIGLGLALQNSVEIGVFFLVYTVVRRLGIKHYYWGDWNSIGWNLRRHHDREH